MADTTFKIEVDGNQAEQKLDGIVDKFDELEDTTDSLNDRQKKLAESMASEIAKATDAVEAYRVKRMLSAEAARETFNNEQEIAEAIEAQQRKVKQLAEARARMSLTEQQSVAYQRQLNEEQGRLNSLLGAGERLQKKNADEVKRRADAEKRAADDMNKKKAESGKVADNVAKFAVAAFAIDKVKWAFEQYIASGVKGAAELKASLDGIQSSFKNLAETSAFRNLISLLSFLTDEATTGLNAVAQGTFTWARGLQNVQSWWNRVRISTYEVIGVWTERDKRILQGLRTEQERLDKLDDALRDQAKAERERADAAEKSRRVDEQRKKLEQDRLDLILKIEDKETAAKVLAEQSLFILGQRKAKINEELEAASKAGELDEKRRTRLITLLGQIEDRIQAIKKAENDLEKQRAREQADVRLRRVLRAWQDQLQVIERVARGIVNIAEADEAMKRQIMEANAAMEIGNDQAKLSFTNHQQINKALDEQRKKILAIRKEMADQATTDGRRRALQKELFIEEGKFQNLLNAHQQLQDKIKDGAQAEADAKQKTAEAEKQINNEMNKRKAPEGPKEDPGVRARARDAAVAAARKRNEQINKDLKSELTDIEAQRTTDPAALAQMDIGDRAEQAARIERQKRGARQRAAQTKKQNIEQAAAGVGPDFEIELRKQQAKAAQETIGQMQRNGQMAQNLTKVQEMQAAEARAQAEKIVELEKTIERSRKQIAAAMQIRVGAGRRP